MIQETNEVEQLRLELADANRAAAQALQDRDLLRNQYYAWERQIRESSLSPNQQTYWQNEVKSRTLRINELLLTVEKQKVQLKTAKTMASNYRGKLALLKAQADLSKAQLLVSKLKRK